MISLDPLFDIKHVFLGVGPSILIWRSDSLTQDYNNIRSFRKWIHQFLVHITAFDFVLHYHSYLFVHCTRCCKRSDVIFDLMLYLKNVCHWFALNRSIRNEAFSDIWKLKWIINKWGKIEILNKHVFLHLGYCRCPSSWVAGPVNFGILGLLFELKVIKLGTNVGLTMLINIRSVFHHNSKTFCLAIFYAFSNFGRWKSPLALEKFFTDHFQSLQGQLLPWDPRRIRLWPHLIY